MDKSVKMLKAEMVNALYEETISNNIEWDDVGKTDYSLISATNDMMTYSYHSWKFEGSHFLFIIKRAIAGFYNNDHLVIGIRNGSQSIINKKEIEDVYVINPLQGLIDYLENKIKEETYPNIAFKELIKRIKDNEL